MTVQQDLGSAQAPEEIVILTGDVEGPYLTNVLTTLNSDISIVHVETKQELIDACHVFHPRRRLIAFVTGVIVPPSVIRGLPVSAYNFHPGPPTFPGSHAASFAIYNGADRFGATVHVMTEHVDAGDIVGVEWFDVDEDARFVQLEMSAYQAAYKLFQDFAGRLANSMEDLSAINESWSGKKHTTQEFETMQKLYANITEEEIFLRYRAFG